MVAGDVVNTAARLQAAAPVTASSSARRPIARPSARRVPRRRAGRGEGEGASRSRCGRRSRARSRFGVDVAQRGRAQLVGRERELDVLRDALARVARERTPQLVTLVGVPGIGKSRLVYELPAVDDDPDLIFWRQGRSLPYGEGVAFWALGEIVKAQAGILETDSAEAPSEARRAVVGLVADAGEARWVEAQLRPLVGVGGARRGRRRPPGRGVRGVAALLRGTGRARPLVLVFEDLHWADDGLLDFVDDLVDWASGRAAARRRARRGPSCSSAGRAGAAASRTPPRSRSRRCPRTRRRGSSPRCSSRRCCRPRRRRRCSSARAATRSTPRSTSRMLAERGLDATATLPLPETVQGIIAARLDALSAEEKALIQDAAVVGKVFWVGALAAIGGSALRGRASAARARAQGVRAARAALLGGGRDRVRVPPRARPRRRLWPDPARAARREAPRAAEWIESLGADREDQAEMLAYHYASALEFARAAGQPWTRLPTGRESHSPRRATAPYGALASRARPASTAMPSSSGLPVSPVAGDSCSATPGRSTCRTRLSTLSPYSRRLATCSWPKMNANWPPKPSRAVAGTTGFVPIAPQRRRGKSRRPC